MFMVHRDEAKVGSISEISELSRRIRIHRACGDLNTKIKAIMKGKESFLVDMVKSLKKVTDEWRGWKHQIFGGVKSKPYVAAIEQVKELFNWTTSTYKETNQSVKSTESYRKFTTETLKTFLKTCSDLESLRVEFQKEILKPLKEFFTDKKASKYINKIELIVIQWQQLLSPGVIQSCHFSIGSEMFLKEAESYEGFHCFYLILRIIPDLCFKAEKCIVLVKNCMDADSSNGYKRERNFLVSLWMPKQKEKLREEEEMMKSVYLEKTSTTLENKISYLQLKIKKHLSILFNLDRKLIQSLCHEKELNQKINNFLTQQNTDRQSITVLQTKQANLATKMINTHEETELDKVKLAEDFPTQYRKEVQKAEYIKQTENLVHKLKLLDKDKIEYEIVKSNIEDLEMNIEHSTNQLCMLKYALMKLRKQIEELKQTRSSTDRATKALEKEKRGMHLELKFLDRTSKK